MDHKNEAFLSAKPWGIERCLAFEPCNDFGNAMRLIARFGDILAFVAHKGWFVWNGARWQGDEDQAMKLGHRVVHCIWDEATALDNKPHKSERERIARLHDWATQSGNESRVRAMLTTAAHYLACDFDDLGAKSVAVAALNVGVPFSSPCALTARGNLH